MIPEIHKPNAQTEPMQQVSTTSSSSTIELPDQLSESSTDQQQALQEVIHYHPSLRLGGMVLGLVGTGFTVYGHTQSSSNFVKLGISMCLVGLTMGFIGTQAKTQEEVWKEKAFEALKEAQDLSLKNPQQFLKEFLLKTLKSQEGYILSLEEGIEFMKNQLQNTDLFNASKSKQLMNSLIFIEFSPLERIPVHLLKKISKCSFQELQKTMKEIAELEKCKNASNDFEIDTLIKNLKVRCLHYLVKCAKTPIFDMRRGIKVPHHIPLIEYLEDNSPLYYRGDRGIAIDLFLNRIKQSFPKGSHYELNVIKNNEFSFFIKTVCEKSGYIFITEGKEVDFDTEEKYFIDISDLMRPFKQNDKSITDYIAEVINVFDDYKKNLVSLDNIGLGGIIKIGNQEIFISQNSFKIIPEFDKYQNTLGLNPEIVMMKHYLIESGFLIESLEESFPFPKPLIISSQLQSTPVDFQSIQEMHLQTMNAMTTILEKCQLDISEHHLSLIKKFMEILGDNLNGLKKWEKIPIIFENYQQAMKSTIRRIEKIQILEKSQTSLPQQKFQEILQASNLIFEDLEYLMVLSGVKLNLDNGLDSMQLFTPHRYAFTSGMRCFMAIHTAILALSEETTTRNAVFLEGSYYELLEEDRGFSKFLEGSFQAHSLEACDIEEKKTELSQASVIYSDLYPNFVTLDEVKKIDVINVVTFALEIRDPSMKQPLVFVLDTATTLFFDDEIREIHDGLQAFIDDKQLIFVVTSSLAKFSQGGTDKYTGGVVLASAHSDFSSFTTELGEHRNRDRFSMEAHRYHSIFLTKCPTEIQHYVITIRKNTDYLYEHLQTIFNEDSLIQLGKRDKGIPMIGLLFQPLLNKLGLEIEYLPRLIHIMQHYTNAKAALNVLPLCIRGSFGFPHGTCVECETALRLTVGLEEEIILDEYAKMLKEIQIEISSVIETKDNLFLKTITYDKNEQPEEINAIEISEACEKYSIELVEIASIKGLNGFLDFLLNALSPEKESTEK